MTRVQVKEIESRLGKLRLLKIDNVIFLTPCNTRVKIIKTLSEGDMTVDELSKSTGAAYSTIIDHMDVLEKVSIVSSFLKHEGGRRRICFKLNKKLNKSVDKVFC